MKRIACLSKIWICCLLLLQIFPAWRAVDNNGSSGAQKKVAVVTLVTTSTYVKGAEVLGESLKRVNAIGDRIVMYVLPEDDPRSDLTEEHIEDLRDAGWKITKRLSKKDGTFSVCRFSDEQLELIESNSVQLAGLTRYWGTCSKFAVWTLTEYDVVVYMDADSLVLNNFDEVYSYFDGNNGATLFAQGTPGCWEDPPDCKAFYGAMMVIKPMPHIHKYLHDLTEKYFLAEGELPLLNEVYRSWRHLPRYTLVAQTETARPRNDPERPEVDWNRVKVYDFSGMPVTKPWVTYELQKEKGDKYAHGYLGRIPPRSQNFYNYMEPQWIWNQYYDAVLERKKQSKLKNGGDEGVQDPDL